MLDFDVLQFCPHMHYLLSNGIVEPEFFGLSREEAAKRLSGPLTHRTGLSVRLTKRFQRDTLEELRKFQMVELEAHRRGVQ